MIETMQGIKVQCDKCSNHTFVCSIQDARSAGWACPNDGAFQWCPSCTDNHVADLRRQIAALGDKRGFVWGTVQPVIGKSDRFFTAEATLPTERTDP